MSCEKRNNSLERCGKPTTSNCVEYVGDAKDCIDLCSNISLTEVVELLASELCIIKTEIAYNVHVPACFGLVDPSTSEILQAMLDKECSLESSIAIINNTLVNFNPIIAGIQIGCLADNPCYTATIKLSDLLNLLIGEICNIKSEITDIYSKLAVKDAQISSLQSQITSQANTIDCLRTQFNAFVTFYNANQTNPFTPPTCS